MAICRCSDAAAEGGADIPKANLMATHWMQAYGDAGLERWVDRSAELARAFAEMVEGSQGAFQLVMHEAPFNVCFWWVPRQLRPYRPDQASAADRALLSKVVECLLSNLQMVVDQRACCPVLVKVIQNTQRGPICRCISHELVAVAESYKHCDFALRETYSRQMRVSFR